MRTMRATHLSLTACLALGACILAACAGGPRTAPAPRVVQVCADFSFPIYFETSSDQLTAAARGVAADAAARVRGCRIGQVQVVGLADAGGSTRLNLALSRRRAASVAKALEAGGLPAPVFDIEGAGESGALTADGRPEPLRRRTEVVIRAAPPLPPAP